MLHSICLWQSPTTEPIITNTCDHNAPSTFFLSVLSKESAIKWNGK